MIVQDLEADPDFAWVGEVLVMARQVLTEAARDGQDFMPVFFMKKGGVVSVNGIVIEGEPTDQMKNRVADFIQERVNELDPDAVAHVADVYMWLNADRKGERREALVVAAETRATNANIVQEYTRSRAGEVVFGTLHVEKPGWRSEDVIRRGARFQGFIARRQRKEQQ
jgi:hypothetical protein